VLIKLYSTDFDIPETLSRAYEVKNFFIIVVKYYLPFSLCQLAQTKLAALKYIIVFFA
jgi:hypothetical protein